MRCQHDGGSGAAQSLDEVPRLPTCRWVETGCGFVEEQQFGLADDPQRQIDTTTLTARQRTDARVDLLIQSDEAGNFISVQVLPVAPSVEFDHLANRELALDARRLQDDANSVPKVAPGSRRFNTEYFNAARTRRSVALENLHNRGFPSSIFPEQGVYLALPDIETDSGDSLHVTVVLAEVADFDGEHAAMNLPGRLGTRRWDWRAAVIAHVLCHRNEVRHQLIVDAVWDVRLSTNLFDGGRHVHEPSITLERTYVKREMSHTQSRVPTFLHVGRGPSPILSEE